MVEVPALPPSRCRHVTRMASPLPTPAHGLLGGPRPTSRPEATQWHEPAQVGRVYPNHRYHPAALRSGMQMGSDSPEQHEYYALQACYASFLNLILKTARDTPEGALAFHFKIWKPGSESEAWVTGTVPQPWPAACPRAHSFSLPENLKNSIICIDF